MTITGDPPLVLYDAPGSPCARRVRITLIEKGLPWDTVIVDLSRLEQKKPEYLRLNPNGVVPTLVHGDRVIYESNVITEYLDDVFPAVRLYPDGPWERARVKLWQAFELSFAKDYRPLMYQRLLGPIVRLTRTLDQALEIARRSTANPLDLDWERRVWNLEVLSPEEETACADRLYGRIEVLEEALRQSPYLVGDHFTQADLSVFPRVRMYPFVQLPIRPARYPRVAEWMHRLEQRPSFAQSLFASERGLQRLGSTPIVPWIAARLKKPRPSLIDRAGLAAARRFFARVMAERDDPGAAQQQARARPPALAVTGRDPPGGAPPSALGADAPRAALDPPPNAPLVLYTSAISPPCRRVEILLRALELAWTSKPVDLARDEQKSPELLRLSPNGEVPILVHGTRVLYDSAVISEYLDASFGGGHRPRFVPADALARARARMWIAYDQGAHKEWTPLLEHEVLRTRTLSADAHTLMRHELARRLDRVEDALAASPFLVGPTVSLADLAWLSRLEMYPQLGIDVGAERYPNIAGWMGRLRASGPLATS